MLSLRIRRSRVRAVQETLVVVVGLLSVLLPLVIHLLHVVSIVFVDARRPWILACVVVLLERVLPPANARRTAGNHASPAKLNDHHDTDSARNGPEQEHDHAHAHARFADFALACAAVGKGCTAASVTPILVVLCACLDTLSLPSSDRNERCEPEK